MLTKLISVSETHFQNTEIALKNQQASIQGLETQIGQLAKLIFERPQDEEGLVVEPRPETVLSIGKDEVGHNEPKPKKGSKNIHKPSNKKEPIHEERRLQIEELDEWQTHKPRKHDKPKPRHEEFNSSKNKLKVRDKVLLDTADPRIATSEPNEETPLTVISIFLYGTVEVNHSKFGKFKASQSPHGQAHGCALGHVKTGQNFPNTGSDKSPRLWEKLPKQHRQ
ncbi:hypothetical protein GOBAR_AA13330 [Gossypium barbadense]|uniref:Uncharacterized protein n=1 Tax=Gossypium barbadense TaxID=3634 RepID=A0A2P5XVH2_GOSBA|nr:hypothetical protein GOBAR_AA13330 [Gossypium barbadense]